MDNFGKLSNDILLDIFCCLLMKYLIWLKCVCKGWQQLISDHVFSIIQSHRSVSISGFFFQHTGFHFDCWNIWYHDDSKAITYVPVEIGGGGHSVFSFLPEDVMVLTSCNGLICCSVTRLVSI